MLPPDLHMNFSKWFYSDIEAIKPRRDCVERCEKRPDKEVVPTRIVPDNSLFRDKLKFLTDDLDQDDDSLHHWVLQDAAPRSLKISVSKRSRRLGELRTLT